MGMLVTKPLNIHINDVMTHKIVFSKKAYLSLVLEVKGKISTETGGVLLGGISSDSFHVVEVLDPGPKSIFKVAYFEYDTDYVNHLATKVSRLYKNSLKIIGLWHRHPGSYDVFSNTDDSTNIQYAKLNLEGAVSLLVNIDPCFRLTCYHVSNPLRYERIPYEIDDSILDKYPLHESEIITESINAYGNKYRSDTGGTFDKLAINEVLKLLNTLPRADYMATMSEESLANCDDKSLNYLLEEMMDDIDYLSSIDSTVTCSFSQGEFKLTSKRISELNLRFIAIHPKKIILFSDGRNWHEYKRGMFFSTVKGGVNVY